MAVLERLAPRRVSWPLGAGTPDCGATCSQTATPLAGGNQAGDIRIGGVRGYSGHRHAIAAAHFARREGDLQEPRRPLRIVIEGLVEVTQPEEQDGIRVLALEPQVLAT